MLTTHRLHGNAWVPVAALSSKQILKTFFLLLVTCLAATPICSFGAKVDEGGCIPRTLINVSVVHHGQASDPYWERLRRGLLQASYHLNINLDVKYSGDTTSGTEFDNNFKAAIAAKPNALIVSIPSDRQHPLVSEAIASGIPIFGLNVGSTQAAHLGAMAHFGMDNRKAGEEAGLKFEGIVTSRNNTLKHCVVINPDVANRAFKERIEGFESFCKDRGALVEVVPVNGASLPFMRKGITKQLEKMKESLDGAVLLTMTPSVAIETEKQLAAIGKSIPMATFDISTDSMSLVRKGMLDFLIDDFPWLQGYLSVTIATLYVTTAQILEPFLYKTGPFVFNRSNVMSEQEEGCHLAGYPVLKCPYSRIGEASVTTSMCKEVLGGEDTQYNCPARDIRQLKIVGYPHGEVTSGYWTTQRGGGWQGALDLRLVNFSYFLPLTRDYDDLVSRYMAIDHDDTIHGFFGSVPTPECEEAAAHVSRKKMFVGFCTGAGGDKGGFWNRWGSPDRSIIGHAQMDEALAGYLGGKKLEENGGKAILFVVGQVHSGILWRWSGLDQYCQERGLTCSYTAEMAETISWDNPESVAEYLEAFIAQSGTKWDSLFLSSDGFTVAATILMQKRKMLVGSFDIGSTLKTKIADGEILFGIDQNNYMQSYMAVHLLMIKWHTGRTMKDVWLKTGPLMVQHSDPVKDRCLMSDWTEHNIGAKTFAVISAGTPTQRARGMPVCELKPAVDCPPGHNLNLENDCVPCDKRYFSVGYEQLKCMPCPAGRYGDKIGAVACSLCGRGTFSNDTGVSKCNHCKPGRNSPTEGNTKCLACAPGTFDFSGGSSQCTRCPIGEFTPLQGQTSCLGCSYDHVPENRKGYSLPGSSKLTTMYLGSERTTDCVCGPNTFFDHRVRACILCDEKPRARNCPGGVAPLKLTAQLGDNLMNSSVVDVSAVALEGFMAADENHVIHMYKCPSLAVCAGMRRIFTQDGSFNKDGMCTGGATGIACGRCKPGFAQRNDACAPCEAFLFSKRGSLLISFAGTLLIITYVYYKSMFPPEPISMAFGTLVGFVQSVGVVSTFGISIPLIAIGPLHFFSMDLSKFEIPSDCITGHNFLNRYLVHLALPLLWIFAFLVLFAICKINRSLIEQVLKRPVSSPLTLLPNADCVQKPLAMCRTVTVHSVCHITLDERVGWFWPIAGPDLINAITKTYGTLFISLTKFGMEIFQKELHPTGEKTLANFKDVKAGSTEFETAIPFAITSLAVYSFGFFALCLYLVYVAPRRVASDPVFRKSFRCLWARFDPDAWWFCIVQRVYAVVLNLLPACISNMRILLINTILLQCFLMLFTAAIQPWRYHLNNITEIGAQMSLTIFIVMFVNLDLGETLENDAFGVAMLLAGISPIMLVTFQFIRFIWREKVTKLEHLQARTTFAQQLHDIMHIVGTKPAHELRSYAMSLLDNDVNRLSQALDTLQFTMLNLQSTKYLRWRCAPVPFEVVTAGRLEGEMIALGILEKSDARESLRTLKSKLHLENKGVRSKSNIVSNRTVNQLFTKIDADQSGSISLEEFLSAFEGTVQSLSREDLTNVFKYLDIHQTGGISRLEFLEALHSIHDPVMPKWWESTPRKPRQKLILL